MSIRNAPIIPNICLAFSGHFSKNHEIFKDCKTSKKTRYEYLSNYHSTKPAPSHAVLRYASTSSDSSKSPSTASILVVSKASPQGGTAHDANDLGELPDPEYPVCRTQQAKPFSKATYQHGKLGKHRRKQAKTGKNRRKQGRRCYMLRIFGGNICNMTRKEILRRHLRFCRGGSPLERRPILKHTHTQQATSALESSRIWTSKLHQIAQHGYSSHYK